MTVLHLFNNQDAPYLTVADLPEFRFDPKSDISLQIAAHLRNVLETFGKGTPICLQIPSILELSGFYRRSVFDVFDALLTLKLQDYEYAVNGLDADIMLGDPLNRKMNRDGSSLRWPMPKVFFSTKQGAIRSFNLANKNPSKEAV